MLVSTDTIKQDLDCLTDDQLQQVATFIAFLKFQNQHYAFQHDLSNLSLLATEFATEDRALAEVGMEDYVELLEQEDAL